MELFEEFLTFSLFNLFSVLFLSISVIQALYLFPQNSKIVLYTHFKKKIEKIINFMQHIQIANWKIY